jgi:hypothetical protein
MNGNKAVLSFCGHSVERQAMILVFDRAHVAQITSVPISDVSIRLFFSKGAML